jgi:hypothetical protein
MSRADTLAQENPMNTIPDDLCTLLDLELSASYAELAHARVQQRLKDTPAHRAAVAGVLLQMDALLDMQLAANPRLS